jgi:hypothetical protein
MLSLNQFPIEGITEVITALSSPAYFGDKQPVVESPAMI